MKITFAAMYLLVASSTLVAATYDSLQTYSFGACDWWQRDNNNTSGMYGCQFRPQTVEVPSASDLIRLLNQYEARVDQLEARIKTLEDAALRP